MNQPAGQGRLAKFTTAVEIALVALLIAVGLTAWGVGIVRGGYDFDEVQRAHSIWLAGQGLRPYGEFFECHPPYFVLLTPIAGSCADPGATLLALRLFAAVGNLAFLAGLVAIGASCLERGRVWAWAGVALVAANPRVLDFLHEFRIDGWGYSLMIWSVVRLRGRSDSVRRYVEFGVLTGIATGLLCPKLVLLPPLVVGFALATGRAALRDRLRAGAGYGVGLAVSVGLFVLYLMSQGIDGERTLLLLARYHAQSNAHSGFRYGLLQKIAAAPLLTGPIVAGLVVWLVDTVRRRARPDSYLAGLAVWLAMQAALVTYPYKQYDAPWFLLGSTFVVVLGGALRAVRKPLGVAALVAGCVVGIGGSAWIGRAWQFYGNRAAQDGMIRVLNTIAAPDDRVVALPPYHPIARRDAFFVWFNTTDPKGYDTEQILSGLPKLAPLVAAASYRAELRAHPPAFVVEAAHGIPATYPPGQKRALAEFLNERGYRTVTLGPLLLFVRPDRYERVQPWIGR